jgi:hypothetical protein
VSATTVETPKDDIIFMRGLLLVFYFIINLNFVIEAPTNKNIHRIKKERNSFLCILLDPTFIQLMSEGSAALLIRNTLP